MNEEKSQRQLKINEELKKVAQDFFQRNTGGGSMITVTAADVSKDLKNANILITVLPQEKEKSALDFAKRMRGDMRTDIKKRLPIKTIPFVEIEIDEGEKNRQKIDALLLKDRLEKKISNEDVIGDLEQ
jgi:ribosome-binding factor A